MSYNTLFGGRDGEDRHRLLAQGEIVVREKPDVLLLQEGKNFDRDGGRRLYEAEAAFGMRAFLAEAPHTGQHTAVLVRDGYAPVAFEPDATHFHHAAAVLTVRAPGFAAPITFVSVHLCPNAPRVRLAEAAYLFAHAAPGAMVLVAGDFNSVSPHDPEPDWTPLPAHFRSRYLAADGRTADREVMASLGRAGFTDVANHLNNNAEPTVPAAGFPGKEFVPFRSDYFLASPALAPKATSYAVIRDERTDIASDHYPIVAEFQL